MILGYAQRVLAEVDGLHLRARGAHRPAARQAPHRRRVPDRPVRPGSACSPTFAPRHPGVAIHMVEDTQEGVLEALRADELDCAFTARGTPTPWATSSPPPSYGRRRSSSLCPPATRCAAARAGDGRGNSPPRTSSPTARTPRCGDGSSARWPIAASSRATRDLHRDGRRARGWRARASGSPCIPRSIAEQPGPPIELRADRARAADVADRTRVARIAAADAGGQGVPQGRARVREKTESEPAVLRAA